MANDYEELLLLVSVHIQHLPLECPHSYDGHGPGGDAGEKCGRTNAPDNKLDARDLKNND